MKLALEAFLVSCEGRLGCLHQKLLVVICGPIRSEERRVGKECRSRWYAHRIYMRIWFPRQTCILTNSCFWPKCCGSDSWDSLPYAVNSQRTTLYQCLTEEDWLACAWDFHRTACWRRLGIVLQKLTPLKTLLGKDSVPYAGNFCGCLVKKAEYLVREIIHVSY